MTTSNLVPVQTFCIHHHIDISFIDSLRSYGLIETIVVEEVHYIPEEKIRELEILVELHDDLDINFEGLDVISHLLTKIRSLQDEISSLKGKLEFFGS